MANILLIDEDHRYRRLLSDQLTSLGHAVTEVALHESGRTLSDLTCHTHQRPDAVIVDPIMPAVDGLLLMRLLCVASRRPVVAHTLNRTDDDVVSLLRAGADGFLPKPCPPAVVDACISALLRRVPPAPPPAPSEVGTLRIDVAGRSVTVEGQPVTLTRTEFDLLSCLAEHPGRVVSRSLLRTRAGGDAVSAASLDALLCRLRRKLAERAAGTKFLHTARGRGVSLHPVPRQQHVEKASASGPTCR
ncbi:response regulator transcription factor [Micromonospora sp. WMMD1274]|nr:response regulator transcription factor [Micromonospora aurantiaca]